MAEGILARRCLPGAARPALLGGCCSWPRGSLAPAGLDLARANLRPALAPALHRAGGARRRSWPGASRASSTGVARGTSRAHVSAGSMNYGLTGLRVRFDRRCSWSSSPAPLALLGASSTRAFPGSPMAPRSSWGRRCSCAPALLGGITAGRCSQWGSSRAADILPGAARWRGY
jgi:hypothetical protein